MRVLVVDDDPLARQVLVSMLAEIAPHAVVHEARDGVAMVGAVRDLRPDVAIIDVDMPRLDGLSAIEQLASSDHETSFVVLSAFADFGFARRGIKLQISDYLLKPVELAELSAALAKAVTDRGTRRRQREALFVSRVTALVQERVNDPTGPRGPADTATAPHEDPFFAYLAAAVFRDRARDQPSTEDFPASLVAGMLGASPRLSCGVRVSPPGARTEVGVVVVRSTPDDDMPGLLDAECQAASGSGILVSAVWALADELEDALAAVEQTVQTPASRLRGRPGRAVPAVTLPDGAQRTSTRHCIGLDAVFEAAHDADEVRYLTAVEHLQSLSTRWPGDLRLTDVAGFAATTLGHPVQWGHPGALFRSLVELGPRLGRRSSGTAASRIGRIQQYLAEHFAEPISLASVAKRFDLTPTYLSALFREKTGKTFLTYLTELRISHARRVLEEDPEVQVRELAALSGYNSARHFSRMFRRLTGYYPSQYTPDGEEPASTTATRARRDEALPSGGSVEHQP